MNFRTSLIASAILITLVVTAGLYFAVPSKCDEEVIKDHIYSLTETYSPEQIEAMIPEIKRAEGCK